LGIGPQSFRRLPEKDWSEQKPQNSDCRSAKTDESQIPETADS
jgi:hypothetical protein